MVVPVDPSPTLSWVNQVWSVNTFSSINLKDVIEVNPTPTNFMSTIYIW